MVFDHTIYVENWFSLKKKQNKKNLQVSHEIGKKKNSRRIQLGVNSSLWPLNQAGDKIRLTEAYRERKWKFWHRQLKADRNAEKYFAETKQGIKGS